MDRLNFFSRVFCYLANIVSNAVRMAGLALGKMWMGGCFSAVVSVDAICLPYWAFLLLFSISV